MDACTDVVARENQHLHARITRKNTALNTLGREVDALRDFAMETRALYGERMPDVWHRKLAALLGETA